MKGIHEATGETRSLVDLKDGSRLTHTGFFWVVWVRGESQRSAGVSDSFLQAPTTPLKKMAWKWSVPLSCVG